MYTQRFSVIGLLFFLLLFFIQAYILYSQTRVPAGSKES